METPNSKMQETPITPVNPAMSAQIADLQKQLQEALREHIAHLRKHNSFLERYVDQTVNSEVHTIKPPPPSEEWLQPRTKAKQAYQEGCEILFEEQELKEMNRNTIKTIYIEKNPDVKIRKFEEFLQQPKKRQQWEFNTTKIKGITRLEIMSENSPEELNIHILDAENCIKINRKTVVTSEYTCIVLCIALVKLFTISEQKFKGAQSIVTSHEKYLVENSENLPTQSLCQEGSSSKVRKSLLPRPIKYSYQKINNQEQGPMSNIKCSKLPIPIRRRSKSQTSHQKVKFSSITVASSNPSSHEYYSRRPYGWIDVPRSFKKNKKFGLLTKKVIDSG